jgi:hypothetical protein
MCSCTFITGKCRDVDLSFGSVLDVEAEDSLWRDNAFCGSVFEGTVPLVGLVFTDLDTFKVGSPQATPPTPTPTPTTLLLSSLIVDATVHPS